MDDVTFSHNGASRPETKMALAYVSSLVVLTLPGGGTGDEVAIYDCRLVWYLL